MTSNLVFEFLVDKQNKTITVKREFSAERSRIWDAYTQSELLDQWWAPKPWKSETKTMDFREGGHWLYAMVGPSGEKHWSIADYQQVQPPRRFTALDAFTDADGNVHPDMPQSKWDVTFTEKGPDTLVEIRIAYDDLKDLEATLEMGFEEGLSKAMENLDALLAAKK